MTKEIASIDEYRDKVFQLSWEINDAINTFFVLCAHATHQSGELSLLKQGVAHPEWPHMITVSVVVNALPVYFFINACRIMERTNTKGSLRYIFHHSRNLSFPYSRSDDEINAIFSDIIPVFEKLKVARGKCIAHLHEKTTPFKELEYQGVSKYDVRAYLEGCEKIYSLLCKAIGHEVKSSVFSEERSIIEGALGFFAEMRPLYENQIPGRVGRPCAPKPNSRDRKEQ